jgi:type I restriction enzyme S subunit
MKTEWTTKPLKHACGVNRDTLGEDTRSNWEMQYLDISAVDSDGNVAALENHTFANAPSRARRRVYPGDTVISTVRTYLKAIAHFDQPPENLIASTGFAVLSPSRGVDSRFLWRAVQSHGFVSGVVANSEGVGYPAIAPSRLANLPISFPNISTQRRIAAYLDEATGKIDRLMSLRRRQMDLLREQRAALIQQAVTRGLNPRAPLKDSGLPWLGQIPEHWHCVPIRRFWEVIDCKHVTVPFLDEGYPLASVSEVQSFDLDLSEAKRTSESFYKLLIEGGRQPRTGDLIYCRNTSVGAAAYVSSNDAIAMGQDVCLIRSSKQNGRYLNYVLHTAFMAEQLNTIMVGATFKRINVADIKALFVVCPPRCEQDEIVAFIERETAKLDGLHRSYERQLALLEEYRASLIHECVTGQRAVGEES